MICEYLQVVFFAYLNIACHPPFCLILPLFPLKGRQHITAAYPRNQREKTDYYQRITLNYCGKISR